MMHLLQGDSSPWFVVALVVPLMALLGFVVRWVLTNVGAGLKSLGDGMAKLGEDMKTSSKEMVEAQASTIGALREDVRANTEVVRTLASELRRPSQTGGT